MLNILIHKYSINEMKLVEEDILWNENILLLT